MKPKMKWMHRLRTGARQFYHHHIKHPGGHVGLDRKQEPEQLNSRWADLDLLEDRALGIQTVSDITQLYLESRFYQVLSATTKVAYKSYLSRITDKFGALPISIFDDRGARTVIRRWRDDDLSSQPRTADAVIAVLRRLLNFAVDEEYLNRNPAAGLGRLHTTTRRDIIWSDSQTAAFLAKAPRHLARVLLLAIWTGQRQADLLSLKWESYDGEYIRLQQRKLSRGSSGRGVKILVSDELRQVLTEIRSEQVARSKHVNPRTRRPKSDFILTTFRGEPWRGGFKCAWRKAVADAGITGVTFHDLRGTFITLSHRAGATIREIAEASGHNEHECERVIRQHYLATGAEQVISRLETAKRFASDKWMAEGAHNTKRSEQRFTGPRYRRSVPKSACPSNYEVQEKPLGPQ